MGVIMRSTVRKAAKFAVYEDIIMRVKNHQMPPTILVEVAWNCDKSERTRYSQIWICAIVRARTFTLRLENGSGCTWITDEEGIISLVKAVFQSVL